MDQNIQFPKPKTEEETIEQPNLPYSGKKLEQRPQEPDCQSVLAKWYTAHTWHWQHHVVNQTLVLVVGIQRRQKKTESVL